MDPAAQEYQQYLGERKEQAVQECNPPTNSWLQTYQDDETRGGVENSFAPDILEVPSD